MVKEKLGPDKILRELQNETSMTFDQAGACKLGLTACFLGMLDRYNLEKNKEACAMDVVVVLGLLIRERGVVSG